MVEEWKGGAVVPEAGPDHSQQGLLFLREGLGWGTSTPNTGAGGGS